MFSLCYVPSRLISFPLAGGIAIIENTARNQPTNSVSNLEDFLTLNK